MLEQTGILVAISATICGGIYFLVKEFRAKQKKYRAWLVGHWGNEGDITGAGKYTHYIDLKLEVDLDDGEVTGVINCRNLKDDGEINNISINGRIYFNTAKITLSTVYRDGELVQLGDASLSFKTKRLLNWKLKQGSYGDYPSATVLWRHDIDIVLNELE